MALFKVTDSRILLAETGDDDDGLLLISKPSETVYVGGGNDEEVSELISMINQGAVNKVADFLPSYPILLFSRGRNSRQWACYKSTGDGMRKQTFHIPKSSGIVVNTELVDSTFGLTRESIIETNHGNFGAGKDIIGCKIMSLRYDSNYHVNHISSGDDPHD